MIFLSLSNLSMSTSACSDEDGSAHLGSKKKQYWLRYCKSGSQLACCHGRSVFFSGNRSVKLLDLNQVITVLNRNVTESTFTYSRLITSQHTVILKGK